MLDVWSARERAMRRAIETGYMPDMNLIHARQRMEGNEPCFGRSEMICQRKGCRWHRDCAALAAFQPLRPLGMRDVPRRASSPAANLGLGIFGKAVRVDEQRQIARDEQTLVAV